MQKRKTIQVISALALLLVLTGFLAACGDPYQPKIDIRRVNFPKTLSMNEGDLKVLRVTIIKPSVLNETPEATWNSDDEDVATVEIFGADHNDKTIPVPKTITVELLVTAKSSGDATITVTVENPNGSDITVDCEVTVNPGTAATPNS